MEMEIEKNYPNFKSQEGNITSLIRKDYLKTKIRSNDLSEDIFDNYEVMSLQASNDPEKPIYFWQLYSILGESPIHTVITLFYQNVFNDNEAPWFRDEFVELGPIEYHVRGQKNFWIDAMGGGKRYNGSYSKVNSKHKLVSNIMTQKGADRWMRNMVKTLNDPIIFLTHDVRVLKCLHDFLNYFMIRYSIEFDFNFYNFINMESKI